MYSHLLVEELSMWKGYASPDIFCREASCDTHPTKVFEIMIAILNGEKSYEKIDSFATMVVVGIYG